MERPCGGEGGRRLTNNDGYTNLYVAIFEKAVKDDLRNEPKRLEDEIDEAISGMYCEAENRAEIREKAATLIKARKKDLKKAIRQRVYNETLSWPLRADDTEYKRVFERIKREILHEARTS